MTPEVMKQKILLFLKKKKPALASFLRKLPFSYTLIRIPKKRILVNDTLSYFANKNKSKDFFVFGEPGVIDIAPTIYLNMSAPVKKIHYKPDDFFMSLSNA